MFGPSAPGGQLVLLMEKRFIDSGTLVCKGEEDYALEGLAHKQNTGVNQQDNTWLIIHRNPSNRFSYIGNNPSDPGGGYWGMTVDMIRITNFGTRSLFVDAVIGYGLEAKR